MSAYHTTFISHAHADNATVADYAARLRAQGIDLWLDLNDAQKGHDLSDDITGQLERRSAFLLMVTAAANESRWVKMELSNYIALYNNQQKYIVNGVERMILPVRLADVPIPGRVAFANWIDAIGRDRQQVVDEIVRALLVPDSRVHNATVVHAPPSPVQPTWDEIAIPARLDRLGFAGWRDKKTRVSFIIPPVRPVAAGKFTMGSDPTDPQAYNAEKGQYSIPVGAFEIGTYPVTVAEYALYLQANPQADKPCDYAFPKYAQWVAPEWRGKTLTWAAQQQRADHPVVCVTWADAFDYAHWLAQITGQPWRLPTEAEWEKAARWDAAHTHARVYPWGDQWDTARANTCDGGPKFTTPIGHYMDKDASSYGCHDMSCNVWEWTSTLWYASLPYDSIKYENDSDKTSARVLRGGSWSDDPCNTRAAFRNENGWDHWDGNWGFRVARGRAG